MTQASEVTIAGPSDEPGSKSIRPRLDSVDIVRGAVMVVMVLDHVRDYLMNLQVSPTDLARTTPALFFTRWITHFCAPTFVLLAGVGAALMERGGRSRGEMARFLLTRGVWLIVLEQTYIVAAVFFAWPKVVLATTLWAIGWSMIVLAGLVWLPRWGVAAFGLVMIAGHNLLDRISVQGAGPWAILWRALHVLAFVPLRDGTVLMLLYPLVPWIGVMAAGYALGPVLLLPHERRRPILLALGLALTAAFVALRALNVYGDPQPWTLQSRPTFTAISFLNCQKYPPSLLYLLMTLGPAITILGILDRGAGAWAGPLRMFGRVPLFFYLLQWPLAHGLAILLAMGRGQPVDWLFRFPPFQSPPGYGEGLGLVYGMWLVVVALLYLPCRWFAGVKRRHRWWWLSYL